MFPMWSASEDVIPGSAQAGFRDRPEGRHAASDDGSDREALARWEGEGGRALPNVQGTNLMARPNALPLEWALMPGTSKARSKHAESHWSGSAVRT